MSFGSSSAQASGVFRAPLKFDDLPPSLSIKKIEQKEQIFSVSTGSIRISAQFFSISQVKILLLFDRHGCLSQS
jgi:hypothetical protein